MGIPAGEWSQRATCLWNLFMQSSCHSDTTSGGPSRNPLSGAWVPWWSQIVWCNGLWSSAVPSIGVSNAFYTTPRKWSPIQQQPAKIYGGRNLDQIWTGLAFSMYKYIYIKYIHKIRMYFFGEHSSGWIRVNTWKRSFWDVTSNNNYQVGNNTSLVITHAANGSIANCVQRENRKD